MRLASLFGLFLVALFTVNFVGGCKKEGPAEKVGAAIDQAADEAADAAEEAKEALD